MLATAVDEGFVKLWTVPTGRQIGTLTGHKRSDFSISFSPDGRTLASMSDDRTVRLWHVSTQRELMRCEFPMDRTAGNSVGFSPDGRSLFACRSVGHFNRLYYAPCFDEIALAEGAFEQMPEPKDAISWHVRGRALEKWNRVEEAVKAYKQTIQHCGNQPDFESIRNTALLHRAKLLLKLGRFAEAGADNCAALNVPPRDPNTPFKCIDLSLHFNGSLDCNSLYRNIPLDVFFASLPRGRQALPGSDGVQFDVRGVVQLNSELDLPGFPRAVEGIAVRQKSHFLYFLHATFGAESEETPIGSYTLHFADGKPEKIPILYDQDLRNYIMTKDPNNLLDAAVAWTGTNSKWGAIRLFSQSWLNPHPEVEIQSLDFVSKMTKCAPFLVAITAESSSPGEIAVADRSGLPQRPAEWHAMGKTLKLRGRFEEALKAFSEVIQQSAGQSELSALRISAFQDRSQLLKRLGRFTKAGADNCAALNVPPRDPNTPARCIDLSLHFNGSLDSEPMARSIPARPFLESLPHGLQALPGSNRIQYDLRGVIQLNHSNVFAGVPSSVDGIQIRQKCRRLHFLHSTGWQESEGAAIGAYVLRYADGRQVEIPLLYGQDLREWVGNSDPVEVRGAKVAWTGTNSERDAIRLFECAWENPHPEIEIETLDFVSKMTKCAPFLVAITAE